MPGPFIAAAAALTAPASRPGTVSSLGVTDLGIGTAGMSSRVPAQRDQPGFQAAFRAQAGHLGAGVDPAQGVGQRQRWLDMTGGPAAGKQYPHATSVFLCRFTLPFLWAALR